MKEIHPAPNFDCCSRFHPRGDKHLLCHSSSIPSASLWQRRNGRNFGDGVHRPVLLQEVLRVLNPKPGGVYIDATVNGGGHLAAVLSHIGEKGRCIGIDRDPELIKRLAKKFEAEGEKRVVLVHSSYAALSAIAKDQGIAAADGILFDLGFSSYHIDRSGRGFSFLRDEPLDMRYDPTDRMSAAEIVNRWSEREIERVLREYGEERFSRRIARAITRYRPFSSTRKLAEVVRRASPRRGGRERIDPATRTFQALRIVVNDELGALETALPQAYSLLCSGGTLAAISFHSAEDRIVKTVFGEWKRKQLGTILTPKPLRAQGDEIRENSRARSARLRAFQKKDLLRKDFRNEISEF